VVGGVGIMNVMYVAVTERTFEIGLRKSIGAQKSDILKQFLFEAIFLTVLGGIIGVALGFLLSGISEHLAADFGYNLKFPVTWKAVLVGFGFSALTGLVFGIYPARKASQMSPMEALRKE
jgi:putative ABC transport system permease protein